MNITARELAVFLGANLEGNPDTRVSKLSKIEEADDDALCFLGNAKYFHHAKTAKAGILLCDETLDYDPDNIKAVLRVKEPYEAFHKLIDHYNSLNNRGRVSGIELQSHFGSTSSYGEGFHLGSFSYVGENVKIGKNVTIYPNSYVGDNVVIGDNTTLYSNVSVYHDCIVGNDCILHAGCVIGSDGFGFTQKEDGTYRKIPQTGNVVIGNRVEIGANTCVDRAVIGSTHLRDGVKLDNLIQVAHNVDIGENTVIAALSGVSGSTKLGKNVLIGGQAGITQHLVIADGVKIQAQAAVIRNITEEGLSVAGVPAGEAREQYRLVAAIKKLPQLIQRVKELEARLGEK